VEPQLPGAAQLPVAGAAPAPASQPTQEQQVGAAPATGQTQPGIEQLLAAIGGA